MGKNAVYWTIVPYDYNRNSELKRISLLFDKVFFKKPSVRVVSSDKIDGNSKYKESVNAINNELKLYEYLQSRKIIEEYDSVPATKSDITSKDELQFLSEYLEGLKQYSKTPISRIEEPSVIYEKFQTTLTVQDIQARVDSVMLSRLRNSEFYPIVKSNTSFTEKGKKTEVVHFVLDQIPEPDADTSWDEIIEYRSDEDSRLKYLALINWINDIARSNYTSSEIKDKYEYLYLDYKRSYERHKIKSTFSTLEIIVAAGTAFFTNNVPIALSIASNFLKIGTSTMNLLKDEGNLPGKEIAYIYHANKEFNK